MNTAGERKELKPSLFWLENKIPYLQLPLLFCLMWVFILTVVSSSFPFVLPKSLPLSKSSSLNVDDLSPSSWGISFFLDLGKTLVKTQLYRGNWTASLYPHYSFYLSMWIWLRDESSYTMTGNKHRQQLFRQYNHICASAPAMKPNCVCISAFWESLGDYITVSQQRRACPRRWTPMELQQQHMGQCTLGCPTAYSWEKKRTRWTIYTNHLHKEEILFTLQEDRMCWSVTQRLPFVSWGHWQAKHLVTMAAKWVVTPCRLKLCLEPAMQVTSYKLKLVVCRGPAILGRDAKLANLQIIFSFVFKLKLQLSFAKLPS